MLPTELGLFKGQCIPLPCTINVAHIAAAVDDTIFNVFSYSTWSGPSESNPSIPSDDKRMRYVLRYPTYGML